jgi:hypothetical protein
MRRIFILLFTLLPKFAIKEESTPPLTQPKERSMILTAEDLELLIEALNTKLDRLMKQSRRAANKGDNTRAQQVSTEYVRYLELYCNIIVMHEVLTKAH